MEQPRGTAPRSAWCYRRPWRFASGFAARRGSRKRPALGFGWAQGSDLGGVPRAEWRGPSRGRRGGPTQGLPALPSGTGLASAEASAAQRRAAPWFQGFALRCGAALANAVANAAQRRGTPRLCHPAKAQAPPASLRDAAVRPSAAACCARELPRRGVSPRDSVSSVSSVKHLRATAAPGRHRAAAHHGPSRPRAFWRILDQAAPWARLAQRAGNSSALSPPVPPQPRRRRGPCRRQHPCRRRSPEAKIPLWCRVAASRGSRPGIRTFS